MPKILRKTLTQFGNAGPTSSFGQFGSKEAGTPQTSQDPTVIQQLAAWVNGWQDAVVTANKAAYMEDMNGWCFVHSYMSAYILQQGIPEWDSGTTYYQNSVVQYNNGQWFNSLQDNNLNNVPPVGASNAFWSWINAPVTPPQAVPTGVILDFAGGSIPSGYLGCDGAAVSRVTYATLFGQIGVTWGIGDGINTFNVPDMRRRVGVGSGGSATAFLGNTVGSTGGEETHLLTLAELPAHTHTYDQPVNFDTVGAGGTLIKSHSTPASTSSVGNNVAFNNLQPSAVVTKIIKT